MNRPAIDTNMLLYDSAFCNTFFQEAGRSVHQSSSGSQQRGNPQSLRPHAGPRQSRIDSHTPILSIISRTWIAVHSGFSSPTRNTRSPAHSHWNNEICSVTSKTTSGIRCVRLSASQNEAVMMQEPAFALKQLFISSVSIVSAGAGVESIAYNRSSSLEVSTIRCSYSDAILYTGGSNVSGV